MPVNKASPPDFLTLFDQLIKLPSVSSANPHIDHGNLAVVELLDECFSRLGFSCEQIPVEPGRKVNLIATRGNGPGGLVLSGHTDTVPFDEALWHSDPLKMTEKDNRLYGLGSTDMKGFFAVVHEAVQSFSGQQFRQPLIILATADEESSMNGARMLTELGRPKARAAIIGEPTGLKPVHMHKGVMMETIRIQGQSGHSSNPALGRNALDAMHEVLGKLISFRQQLATEFRNPHFQIDIPTLNLGAIHGGDNPNRICGHCQLEFDVRLMPGMECGAVRENIQALIEPIAAARQVKITQRELFPGVPAFDNHDSELARLAGKLTGHDAHSVAFGTEAPFLQQLGMDTVVMGPGSIDLAHQPDEYLDMHQIKPGIELLQKMIGHYCL